MSATPGYDLAHKRAGTTPGLAPRVARADAVVAHSSCTKMSISSEAVAPLEPETVTYAV